MKKINTIEELTLHIQEFCANLSISNDYLTEDTISEWFKKYDEINKKGYSDYQDWLKAISDKNTDMSNEKEDIALKDCLNNNKLKLLKSIVDYFEKRLKEFENKALTPITLGSINEIQLCIHYFLKNIHEFEVKNEMSHPGYFKGMLEADKELQRVCKIRKN